MSFMLFQSNACPTFPCFHVLHYVQVECPSHVSMSSMSFMLFQLSARPTWASIKPMVLRVGLVIGTEDSRTDSHISATSGALPGSLALELAEGETANEETTSESKSPLTRKGTSYRIVFSPT